MGNPVKGARKKARTIKSWGVFVELVKRNRLAGGELLAIGKEGMEYDAWLVNIADSDTWRTLRPQNGTRVRGCSWPKTTISISVFGAFEDLLGRKGDKHQNRTITKGS